METMESYSEKRRSSCGLAGLMNENGERMSGEKIINSISVMQERSSGLGGGFSAYGIYPDYSEQYAFHLIYENKGAKEKTEKYIGKNFDIIKDEAIPTREPKNSVSSPPILWRYFLDTKEGFSKEMAEKDFVMEKVMEINRGVEDAFVISSGKNMGIFKGVGFPRDIGRYYRLSEYEGYTWIAHGRFPTNTSGWWGGAHPFGLLDWSIAHNGEISSYGINRRALLDNGYHCALDTDSEVIAYLFDLLGRKHDLDFDTIADVLAAPFWEEIDREGKEMSLHRAIRITYGSELVNGPFAVIVGKQGKMVGLNDRIKLRPLVVGREGDMLYMASEESGIREVCHNPDRVWAPKAGEPVVGELR